MRFNIYFHFLQIYVEKNNLQTLLVDISFKARLFVFALRCITAAYCARNTPSVGYERNLLVIIEFRQFLANATSFIHHGA